MELHAWGALYAGFFATLAMLLAMYVFVLLRLAFDMPRLLGFLFTGPENLPVAYVLGFGGTFTMGVLFAFFYAFFFAQFRWPLEWDTGPWLGLVHGLVAAGLLGFLPLVHPRMGEGRPLGRPGPFGTGFGMLVPLGTILLHMLYGLVLGAVYGPA
ncbi:MAG: hypothetical protein M0017_10625 [Desulfobacteraceae bacterium]|nr:hypothetical protein [Desulfobacteraceae bacterium]